MENNNDCAKTGESAAISFSNEVFSVIKYANLSNSLYIKGKPLSFDIATINLPEQ